MCRQDGEGAAPLTFATCISRKRFMPQGTAVPPPPLPARQRQSRRCGLGRCPPLRHGVRHHDGHASILVRVAARHGVIVCRLRIVERVGGAGTVEKLWLAGIGCRSDVKDLAQFRRATRRSEIPARIRLPKRGRRGIRTGARTSAHRRCAYGVGENNEEGSDFSGGTHSVKICRTSLARRWCRLKRQEQKRSIPTRAAASSRVAASSCLPSLENSVAATAGVWSGTWESSACAAIGSKLKENRASPPNIVVRMPT